MIGRLVELWGKIGLKVKAEKSNVMVLGGEEISVFEVSVAGRQLECTLEFKYLGFVLVETCTDGAEWEDIYGCD